MTRVTGAFALRDWNKVENTEVKNKSFWLLTAAAVAPVAWAGCVMRFVGDILSYRDLQASTRRG